MENNENFVDNFKQSTLENIDFALFDWVDKTISANCNTKEGFRKVPVVWASAERAFQIKNYKDLRDKDGSLITPFISVERGSITKNLTDSRSVFRANVAGFDRIGVTTVINQEKTSKYANNDAFRKSKKINYGLKKTPKTVYQTKFIRIPTYINVEYTISIKTSFLQQINEILQPFISYTRGGVHFLIKNEGFQYEAFMGDSYGVEESSSDMDVEERKYVSKLTVKVTGYLIGEDVNQDDQKVQTYENPVEIKFPKEDIIIEERNLLPKKKIPEGRLYQEPVSAVKKIFLIGNGVDSIYTVRHNLNTRDILIIVRENFGDYARVEVAIGYEDLNQITLDMGDIIEDDSYAVIIIG